MTQELWGLWLTTALLGHPSRLLDFQSADLSASQHFAITLGDSKWCGRPYFTTTKKKTRGRGSCSSVSGRNARLKCLPTTIKPQKQEDSQCLYLPLEHGKMQVDIAPWATTSVAWLWSEFKRPRRHFSKWRMSRRLGALDC
ncbi:uncharacterized protein LOC144084420 [Stigmatopora argus]